MLLNVQLQQFMNLVGAEATVAKHSKFCVDGVVEILGGIWEAIQAQSGRGEDVVCLQMMQYRFERTVKICGTQQPTPDMLWQHINMDMEFGEAVGAILQIGTCTGKLYISAQLADIARTVIEQESAQHLWRDMDICPDAAALGRK